MAYSSLLHFISELEKQNEIIRIDKFVDPLLEISEITDRFSKLPDGGKALLFTNNGTDIPVLTNSMGSLKRLSIALGVKDIEDVNLRMEQILKDLTEPRKSLMEKLSLLPKLSRLSGFFPSEFRGKAPVQEIMYSDPDLEKLPVLKTWPYDGGRFFTLPMVITIDPETGERNVGMYRMQVFNRNTTGMHWHRHKTGANHFEKYRKAGRKMPVAVALGGDPVLTYSATAPLPENVDEFLFAGFLRQKSIAMAPALSQNIMIPAEADIIIEGYVDPQEDKTIEGPFGDHTGFYSLEDHYPIFHVTAVTRRKNAIFPATLVGIPPQEDAKIARATEKIFFMPIRQAIVPELEDMKIPDFGVAHNLTLVKIKKSYPGQARKVMNALWGAGQMMFNKIMIVSDTDIDLNNTGKILEKASTIDPFRDLVFSEGPLDVLDHASDYAGYGGKLGIDLTAKLREEYNPGISSAGINLKEKTEKIADITRKKIFNSPSGETLMCLMNIRKHNSYTSDKFRDQLMTDYDLREIPYLFYTDEYISLDNIHEFLWFFLNNIEVRRDIRIFRDESQKTHVIIDGSSKIGENEDFPREWPNVVTMSDDIIQVINKKWSGLNLGELIKSPSVYYNNLIVTPGASIRRK